MNNRFEARNYFFEVAKYWNSESSLGLALMNICLKNITGYRMQLFLTIKSSGVSELGTKDCWVDQTLDKK